MENIYFNKKLLNKYTIAANIDFPKLHLFKKISYRIHIKVRWCIDSSLQKIFWKFIQHTLADTRALPETSTHNHAHLRIPHTPAHTSTHPLTPAYTHVHVCTTTSTHVHVYILAHTCAHLCTPIHTCAHICTPAHTHTHPQIPHTYPLMPLTW